MGRGPATTAQYEKGVELYINGTRQRYNDRTQGHDRGDGAKSNKYEGKVFSIAGYDDSGEAT